MLVDDEAAVRGVMRDALERAGFTVLEAGHYDEAMLASQDMLERMELLIADVSLPGRNGCELANELKRQRPKLPCLFISGYTGAEVCRAYGVGITDIEFLAKPFEPRELVERAELLLARSHEAPGTRPPAARPDDRRDRRVH